MVFNGPYNTILGVPTYNFRCVVVIFSYFGHYQGNNVYPFTQQYFGQGRFYVKDRGYLTHSHTYRGGQRTTYLHLCHHGKRTLTRQEGRGRVRYGGRVNGVPTLTRGRRVLFCFRLFHGQGREELFLYTRGRRFYVQTLLFRLYGCFRCGEVVFLQQVRPTRVTTGRTVSGPGTLTNLFTRFFVGPGHHTVRNVHGRVGVVLGPGLTHVHTTNGTHTHRALCKHNGRPVTGFIFQGGQVPDNITVTTGFFGSHLFNLQKSGRNGVENVSVRYFPFVFVDNGGTTRFVLWGSLYQKQVCFVRPTTRHFSLQLRNFFFFKGVGGVRFCVKQRRFGVIWGGTRGSIYGFSVKCRVRGSRAPTVSTSAISFGGR